MDQTNSAKGVGYWGQPRAARQSAFGLLLHAFVPLLALLLAAGVTIHTLQLRSLDAEIERSARTLIALIRGRLEAELQGPVEDLRFLQRELETQPVSHTHEITQRLRNLSETRRRYDTLRWLGADGRELARIDGTGQKPRVATPAELGDWSTSHVFEAASRVQPGEIYVSSFELRREHGRVTEPFRPIVRFAAPYFDAQRRRAGMLILDLNGREALATLDTHDPLGRVELLTSDGYWIKAHDPALAWGAVLRERERLLFSTQHAHAWGEMNRVATGAIRTGEGGYWFATLRAPQAYAHAPRWILVLHVEEHVFRARERHLAMTLAALVLLGALMPLPFLWRLARRATAASN